MIRLGALALAIALGAGLPAAPALADPVAHLRVTATFDKEWYLRDSPVHVKITITNDGQLPAREARGFGGGNFETTSGWEDFAAETVIEPGATRTVDLTARIPASTEVSMYFQGGIFYSTGSGYASEYLYTWAWIAEGLGDFGGLIYGDANVNDAMDAGETGLAGVSVELSGHQPAVRYQATTDARGRFEFADIPTGGYSVQYSGAPDPWMALGSTGYPWDEVVIDESPQHSDIRVGAIPSLLNTLQINLFFEHDSYQVGDPVQLTVALTNRGTRAIIGITAHPAPGSENQPSLCGGPGWGPLAEGGPGVTVAAGQTTVVTVTDQVPELAPRFGRVSASCAFGGSRYPPYARVSASTSANVAGVPGTGRARIVNDSNGAGVAGLTVAVTDPDTGAVVARAVTDADGVLVVDGLPATVYDVRIEGPWKPLPGYIFGYQLPVIAGESTGEPSSLRVVPGSAQDNLRPNLKVSAAFEKPAYNAGDAMRTRLTVTNIGAGAAEGVRASPGGLQPAFPITTMGELDYQGPGVRIEAGATRVFEFEGTDWRPQGISIFSGWVQAAGYDLNSGNNQILAMARLNATRAGYSGVLYGDLDDDGTVDPGEAFRGTPIDLSGGAPYGVYRATTNERGEFSFPDIPTGRYIARYHIPDGWRISSNEVVLREGAGPVEVRAVRPTVIPLEPAIAFTKDTYAAGEKVHLTITLTNRGTTDLTGITTFCSGPGNGHELYSGGPGWGVIGDERGPGVTVRAGRTETFDVWDVIPESAYEWGYVTVFCDFGAPPDHTDGPSAHAKAKVPGGIGNAGGMLVYDRNNDHKDEGDGIADTKIVLLDEDTGGVAARAVTDANGHFMFNDVPAGHYEVLVVGPWKIVECWCWGVFAGRTYDDFQVAVVPGAVQRDPDAPPPPAPSGDESPPIEQAAIIATTALAATGVSVVGLVVGALIMLAAGCGLVLIRRRRRA